MKNKHLSFIILLSLLLVFSCKKEDNTREVESDFFWAASIHTKRTKQKIDLFFNDSRYIIDYIEEPADPDYFDVYFSNDADNLPFFKKVEDTEIDKLIFDNLKDNEAYYFQVVTGKKGYESITSPRLMTTTGQAPEMESLYPQNNFEIERLTYSFDRSYFTFNSDNRGRNDNIYIQKNGENFSFKILDNTNYSVGWSPVKNELVYTKDTLIGNFIYPRHLLWYEVETERVDTLITIDYEHYYIQQPRFTADGQKVLFLSSEGNAEKHHYDFWTYDLTTREKVKHSDLYTAGFEIFDIAPQYAAHNQLFLSGYYKDRSEGLDIFTYDYTTNTIIPIIESEWRDARPSGSPGGSKVAFFSYRSGSEQLWVYDLINQKYQQITDYESPAIDGRYSRIVWEDEETLVTSVYDENQKRVVRMKIE